jgi:FO synthase
MLESASERLCARGGPHFGSPDKRRPCGWPPSPRPASARPVHQRHPDRHRRDARERLDALIALRDLHRATATCRKSSSRTSAPSPAPDGRRAGAVGDELLWTVAAARLSWPGVASRRRRTSTRPTAALIDAGLDDWGGISPVTIDHVNPEAPWPQIERPGAPSAPGRPPAGRAADRLSALRAARRALAGPACAGRAPARRQPRAWPRGRLEPRRRRRRAGTPQPLAGRARARPSRATACDASSSRAVAARACRRPRWCACSRPRRARPRRSSRRPTNCAGACSGETVTYVVNRNINYTNICTFSCRFCAFSKTSQGGCATALRPRAGGDRRARPRGLERGATEVCLQGGIHPATPARPISTICAR